MVKDVQAYIITGTDWSPWVNAYGGNDAEPSFSSAYWARDWYSGYGAVASARRIYDFGSADGCPLTYYLSGGFGSRDRQVLPETATTLGHRMMPTTLVGSSP
jgi:hypothetical protein